MQLVVPDPSRLDTESDADLLLIAFAGDEAECRLAANAFFRRYVSQLYRFCQQFHQTMGGEEGVRDLVLITFQRAFERAGTFNGNGSLDENLSHARTLKWLEMISRNLMLDWLKSISEDHPLPLTSIKIPDDQVVHAQEETVPRRYARLPEDAADHHAGREFISNDGEVLLTISPESQCLEEALANLTEREREVILISVCYFVDGKQLRLPQDILDGLCKRLETTKENIRMIRKRALEKIKKYAAMHR